MLYKLGLKVTGFRLYFGCMLVTIQRCYNVIWGLHFYVVTTLIYNVVTFLLYKLGLKVTGFRLYFGCILVVCWSQYNVVTTLFGVYIFTLSQR